MLITNVHLPHLDKGEAQRLFSVLCENGQVRGIEPIVNGFDNPEPASNDDGKVINGNGGLLLPSLCHSHIHLDKCYILEHGDPLVTGDFSEALKVTSAVKEGFATKVDDLYARGKRLIQESVACGVTSMRAHVEVDAIVGTACLDVALRLHEEYQSICDVEIAVFMQDPIFDSEGHEEFGENAAILRDVLDKYSSSKAITAIGSAPYVERTRQQRLQNIDFIISLAEKYNLHLDLHLDYDLKSCDGVEMGTEDEPLIFPLLARVASSEIKSLTLGHMTRLSVFTPSLITHLHEYLQNTVSASRLKSISFVGLPQSDLYMMGRRRSSLDDSDYSFGAPSTPRGTLDVPRFRRFCDAVNEKSQQTCGRSCAVYTNVAMSVNNVTNAFTPQGTPDPLSLCPLGVAVYQDATPDGCRILLESISTASKLTIGENSLCALIDPLSLLPSPGQPSNFVLLHDNHDVQNAVLSPCYSRTTIKDGKVVARRIGTVKY